MMKGNEKYHHKRKHVSNKWMMKRFTKTALHYKHHRMRGAGVYD